MYGINPNFIFIDVMDYKIMTQGQLSISEPNVYISHRNPYTTSSIAKPRQTNNKALYTKSFYARIPAVKINETLVKLSVLT